MICTTCATLNIMCMYYLRLLPSFSHLIRFRGTSPAFRRKIRVRRPRRARKNRSCCQWNTPSSPETSHSRYTTLVDNPFRSDPSRGQVDFVFWGLLARHSDFPGYERDVTRISLRIALRTLDLQMHALNSLPSGPRAQLLFNQSTLLPLNKSGTRVRTY